MQTASNLLQQLIDSNLLSPEFIGNTNANTNTNVTSSQMVRLHDKTSARQSYVHCSVQFCSVLQQVHLRRASQECPFQREVARFTCAAAGPVRQQGGCEILWSSVVA